VIPYQGFLKLKCPVWVPVRAQPNLHGSVRVTAAIDHSLISTTGGFRGKPIVVRKRLVCKHPRSGLWQPPRSGLLQPPPGRSHTHFADREQEHTPGFSVSRIIGMGSHMRWAYNAKNSWWYILLKYLSPSMVHPIFEYFHRKLVVVLSRLWLPLFHP